MKIIKATFHDWNGNDRTIEITSNMCEALHLCRNEEELFYTAITYLKRRYTECMSVLAVEIIAD